MEVVHDDVVDLAAPAPPRVAPSGSTPAPAKPKRRLLVAGVIALVLVVAIVAAVIVTRGDNSHTSATPRTSLPGIKRPTGYTPRYVKTACPSALSSVPEATCGYLYVPQDRAKPTGRQVRLLIEQAPPRVRGASKAAPTIDVCGCSDLATSLTRDHSRLILVGSRGYTNSDPDLTCPELERVTRAALAKPSDDPAELAAETTAIARCHERWVRAGVDPAQYNFVTDTQDVIDLMVALHIKSADFTGSDLSSAVVFGVLRQAPAAVRSITLDDPAPPGASLLTDPIGDLAHAFSRYTALCRSSAVCAKSYPDLEAAYLAAWRRLDAHPQLVATPNPDDSSAPPVPVLMDGPRVADALATALDDPSTYGLIPAAVSTDTATELIASQVLKGDYYSWHADAPWGAQLSYLCAYDVNTLDPNALALEARTLPQFQGAQYAHWNQWCSAWKVPNVYDALSTAPASPVPALLVRGDLSPIGSGNWLSSIESGLPNAESAVFPTLGGDLISGGPPCLSRLRRTFLAKPSANLDRAAEACVQQSPAISFDAPAS